MRQIVVRGMGVGGRVGGRITVAGKKKK